MESFVPKLGMQPVRRRQLILATIQCMSDFGFEHTTIARIGRAANVTPSIVHHYFGGKDALLAASMRFLLEQLRQSVVRRLSTTRDPRTRVEMIVAANFSDEQFSSDVIGAWMAFWSQAQHHPALHRLYRVYARRLHSNLCHALRQLLDDASVERAAFGLASLIDGLWLNCALSGEVNGTLAREVACNYVANLLGPAPAPRTPIPETSDA